MKLLKMELHDPLFCLDEEITKKKKEDHEVIDDSYSARVAVYWDLWNMGLADGMEPRVSCMVWQG